LIAGAHIDLQQRISIDILDGSLNMLLALHGDERRNVVLAICETAAHDGRLNAAEGELIRVICATLDCPMPPIQARSAD
jgi:tellurite resistance protein